MMRRSVFFFALMMFLESRVYFVLVVFTYDEVEI